MRRGKEVGGSEVKEGRNREQGDTAQEVRAVVWSRERVCRFDPTLGVSKCP